MPDYAGIYRPNNRPKASIRPARGPPQTVLDIVDEDWGGLVRFLEEAEAAQQHRAVAASAEPSYPEAGAAPSRSWGDALLFPTPPKKLFS